MSNYKQILTKTARLPDNGTCVDCDFSPPTWASINLGVFICMNCAGVHRSLGTHISQVRSIELDKWTMEMVEGMRRTTNKEFNRYYEYKIQNPATSSQTTSATTKKPNWYAAVSAPTKLTPLASDDERTRYIRNKYEHRMYFGVPETSVAPTSTNTPTTSNTSTATPTVNGNTQQYHQQRLQQQQQQQRTPQSSQPAVVDLFGLATDTSSSTSPSAAAGTPISVSTPSSSSMFQGMSFAKAKSPVVLPPVAVNTNPNTTASTTNTNANMFANMTKTTSTTPTPPAASNTAEIPVPAGTTTAVAPTPVEFSLEQLDPLFVSAPASHSTNAGPNTGTDMADMTMHMFGVPSNSNNAASTTTATSTTAATVTTATAPSASRAAGSTPAAFKPRFTATNVNTNTNSLANSTNTNTPTTTTSSGLVPATLGNKTGTGTMGKGNLFAGMGLSRTASGKPQNSGPVTPGDTRTGTLTTIPTRAPTTTSSRTHTENNAGTASMFAFSKVIKSPDNTPNTVASTGKAPSSTAMNVNTTIITTSDGRRVVQKKTFADMFAANQLPVPVVSSSTDIPETTAAVPKSSVDTVAQPTTQAVPQMDVFAALDNLSLNTSAPETEVVNFGENPEIPLEEEDPSSAFAFMNEIETEEIVEDDPFAHLVGDGAGNHDNDNNVNAGTSTNAGTGVGTGMHVNEGGDAFAGLLGDDDGDNPNGDDDMYGMGTGINMSMGTGIDIGTGLDTYVSHMTTPSVAVAAPAASIASIDTAPVDVGGASACFAVDEDTLWSGGLFADDDDEATTNASMNTNVVSNIAAANSSAIVEDDDDF